VEDRLAGLESALRGPKQYSVAVPAFAGGQAASPTRSLAPITDHGRAEPLQRDVRISYSRAQIDEM
jgi:hypothetical protein